MTAPRMALAFLLTVAAACSPSAPSDVFLPTYRPMSALPLGRAHRRDSRAGRRLPVARLGQRTASDAMATGIVPRGSGWATGSAQRWLHCRCWNARVGRGRRAEELWVRGRADRPRSPRTLSSFRAILARPRDQNRRTLRGTACCVESRRRAAYEACRAPRPAPGARAPSRCLGRSPGDPPDALRASKRDWNARSPLPRRPSGPSGRCRTVKGVNRWLDDRIVAVRFTLNRSAGRDAASGCRKDQRLIVPLTHVVVAPPTQMVPSSGSRSM